MEGVVLLYASTGRLEGWGVSCRWRDDGARNMEVSLITGDCSNVGITYTKLPVGLAGREIKGETIEKN